MLMTFFLMAIAAITGISLSLMASVLSRGLYLSHQYRHRFVRDQNVVSNGSRSSGKRDTEIHQRIFQKQKRHEVGEKRQKSQEINHQQTN